VAERGWQAYGADPGGTRYSPLSEITRENVARLEPAWTYRTGDATHDDGSEGAEGSCGQCHRGASKFEATPIHAAGRLYLSTPLNRVIALDPTSGEELWRHDPEIDLTINRSEGFVSRGVAFWADTARSSGVCNRRIFFGTIDARLLSLDATTGSPCADFGDRGTVRLDVGVGRVQVGQFGVTSPPAMAGDVVIVGSSMGDNRRVDMERGTVRGYDARTGALRWSWDPIPRSPSDSGYDEWTAEAAAKTGAANAWAPLSVDPERDLVFVPTGSAAPDFYGGERPGDNRHANAVVALRASTGALVWSFQVVHHDLWDYDVASQPSLISVPRDGSDVPAVVVPTKLGHLFVLDRETGEPLFRVVERTVPESAVPGEVASPTQPFPVRPAPLHPHVLREEDLWGATEADREACVSQFRSLRNDGVFTPPSLEGTLMFPGFGGGMNWGGAAYDPERNFVIVNTMRLAMWVRLHERESSQRGNQLGTPYHMTRGMLISPSGLPCNGPPWGTLAAVDVGTGAIRWDVPLGRIPALGHIPESANWGSLNLGGPMVTAGGLVFIGSAMDDYLRAFDAATGKELWKGALPAGGQATPMTFSAGGRQYVVIAAGGNSNMGSTFGDHLVAFALPGTP
jgi:quinoprotein glucose dehydrogenase